MSRPEDKSEKVAHVKAARQTRYHGCHWPGCGQQVPPAMWGCRLHWFKLPKEIRNKIWLAYQIGQEEGEVEVSEQYLEAAEAAQEWIRRNAL